MVCRTPGPTACLELLHELLHEVCLKRWRKEKKSMTGPGQPRTCNHPINAQTLTRVCQVVRMFLLVNFKYISRHTIVCRAAQEAGAPHREYINRKKENAIFTPM